MGAHADLRASALLALTKLMAIEPGFCDMNLRLLFTLLQNRCPPIGTRAASSALYA